MHLSEMAYEVRESYEKYVVSPVAHLDQLGILNNRFLTAHANLARMQTWIFLRPGEYRYLMILGQIRRQRKILRRLWICRREGLSSGWEPMGQ